MPSRAVEQLTERLRLASCARCRSSRSEHSLSPESSAIGTLGPVARAQERGLALTATPDACSQSGGHDLFVQGPAQAFANLAAVPRAAGDSLADAVGVGVHLRDMGNFQAMNGFYPEFFREPLPERTTIQSDLPSFEIEVDGVLFVDA